MAKIVSGAMSARGRSTLNVPTSVISNFALVHFEAAKLMRDHVLKIETANAGQPHGPFFDPLRSYCSACIVSFAAALEALINELFIAHNSPLRKAIRDFDKEFWGDIERKPILVKYQQALQLMGQQQMPKTAAAYENAGLLIDVRNTLIHFKPTWDSPRKRAVDLEKALAGKFALSPFFGSNTSFIGMRCMSAGCAQWAVETVSTFIAEFGRRSQLNPDKKLEAFV